MLTNAAVLGIFTLISLVIPASMIALTLALSRRFRSRRRRSRIKYETYESGVPTIGTAWIRFHVQYYLFALLFVVFDVETVFLFPFAAQYRALGPYALAEAGLFIAILLVGLVYAWRRGVLRWN